MHHRIAVGGRARDDFRANDAIGTGTIIDDERLASLTLKLRGECTRQHVRAAAGTGRQHHTHRALRIGIGCACRSCRHRQKKYRQCSRSPHCRRPHRER